jgi:hypothetical protein
MLLDGFLVDIVDFEFTFHGAGDAIPVCGVGVGVASTTGFGCCDVFFFDEVFDFVAVATPDSEFHG